MVNPDSSIEGISETLSERVLAALGFASRPAANRAGLAALQAAWCQGVPFDNTRKRIALRLNDHWPLPGDSPADFLESWLEDGAGGTCWAMPGAGTAILAACGFRAQRRIATTRVAPDLSDGQLRRSRPGATLRRRSQASRRPPRARPVAISRTSMISCTAGKAVGTCAGGQA